MATDLLLPKYHQIYLVLKEQLREGQFSDGLPGEFALMERFGVARVTVRRALELLAKEGFIHRQAGRKTVPVLQAETGRSTQNKPRRSGLLDNLVSISLGTRIKVLSVEIMEAPTPVLQALQLAPKALVQKAVRVRSTRHGPLSHITTHVPAHLTAHFDRRALSREPILVLLEKSGLQLGQAQQSISACLAHASVAAALGVDVGSALLSVRRLVFDQQDRPIQWLHGLYRPDRYEYEMTLSRVGDLDARIWAGGELTTQYH